MKRAEIDIDIDVVKVFAGFIVSLFSPFWMDILVVILLLTDAIYEGNIRITKKGEDDE